MIRYLLENQPGISSSLECRSPREAESYLKGMAEVDSHERFVILCNEKVGLTNGGKALMNLRSTFPDMDLFTVLMRESLGKAHVGVDLRAVDEQLEKKVELQDLGEEVGRVIVAAGKGVSRRNDQNRGGFYTDGQDQFMAFQRFEKEKKRRFPFLQHLFPLALN